MMPASANWFKVDYPCSSQLKGNSCAHNPQRTAVKHPTLNDNILSLSYLVGKNNFREGNKHVLRVQLALASRLAVDIPRALDGFIA